ncbi:MAG TPA: CbiX/SirB N-terminal domain-containing protein [Burkholderiales bacterium]|nr:CbiX/SirB N-terminal domain-containing protein [Burkholderiales bacterium]
MSAQAALVLFAHGARDPAWALPFEKMAARIRGNRPGLRVELAFLESMQPTLASVASSLAAQGVDRITLVPLFLAQGGHLREDLPRLIEGVRRELPMLKIDVTTAIGDSAELTNAIADWALAQHFASQG